jgi:2,4-dienoyl-CoA reductase-like NADH-dependent reductase (Old Yellow Enzyme family)
MPDVDLLFEPVTVNKLTLPNRIVMSPMGRNFAAGGIVPPGFVDYFAKRAAGGVGLCVGEASAVGHPVASSDAFHSFFHGSESLSAWAAVAAAVHANGAKFMPQLWHAGLLRPPASDHPDIPNSNLHPVGPSGWAEPLVHTFGWVTPITQAAQIAEPMTQADIDDVIEAFAEAAVAAQSIGCDGVNIHGAHGYIIDQFFWDRTNKRMDAYGGDLKARTRFACDLIAETRRRVGPDFALFFRFSQWKQQDYHCKLAETPEDLATFLQPLADAGIDLFDCSTRRFWEPEFAGSHLNLAGWVKKLTGKPTMTVGSVGLNQSNWADEEAFSLSDSGLASLEPLLERLARGEFDLVGLGRMLISNPDWPTLVREGRYADIKPYSNTELASLN